MSAEHTPTPWHITAIPDSNEKRFEVCYFTRDLTEWSVADNVVKEDAEHIVRCVNHWDELVAALERIELGEGRFSRDPLTHASNCVEDMIAIAREALARARGQES